MTVAPLKDIGAAALRVIGGQQADQQLVEFHNSLAACSAQQWLECAARLLENDDVARAKLLLETYAHEHGTDHAALLLLARTAIQQGRPGYNEAITLARRCWESASGSSGPDIARSSLPEAGLTLGCGLGLSARLQDALEQERELCRSEAINVLTTSISSLQSQQQQGPQASGGLQAQLHYNAAVLLAENGQEDAAMQHAKQALGAATAAAAGRADASGAAQQQDVACLSLVLLAMLLSARQQHADALAVLTAATAATEDPAAAGPSAASTPTAAAAQSSQACGPHAVLLARLHAALLKASGDTPGALAVLVRCKLHLGNALQQQQGGGGGDAGAAASARALAQREASVWRELAQAFADAGSDADALFCVEAAQQAEPWSADTHFTLGYVHAAAGRTAAGLESMNTALALDPHHAQALAHTGALQCHPGPPGEASVSRDLLTESLRCRPADSGAWHRLGLVCRAMQQRGEAERHLHTAVVLAGAQPAAPYGALPLLLAGCVLP